MNTPSPRLSFRERLAKMSREEILAAARASAVADVARREAGLLDVVDDRAEVLAIIEERLPVLLEVMTHEE